MPGFKALYSKYRPSNFKEVLGQDHVTKVLEESIKLGNVSHAYLFSGSRGIGKTTIARILASEIGTSADDLYEIDAASNTSVEDIRALNEAVNTLPFNSDHKVYILDEVHMLSKNAFNALLKTLEEPPSHVIFMLATTEPHKIPDTVISRCEQYTLKQPTQKLLKEMITATAKEEGYTLDPSSADLVALLADGSFRDAQGTLQKVINSSKDKKISVEEVEKITGAPQTTLVNDFIDAIASGDADKGLGTVGKAIDQNIDMKVYLSMILAKVRAILLTRFSKSAIQKFEDSLVEEDVKKLKEWAGKGGENINSKALERLLDAYIMTGSTYLSQIPLELALIDLCSK
jgi:DNA polymerase III subunit gamma/tau